MFDSISKVFCSVMAGDALLHRSGMEMSFEMSGTKAFLDNLVKTQPDFFQSKRLVMELMQEMTAKVIVNRDIRDEGLAVESLYDDFLDHIFISYVDDAFKEDKEVVVCFLSAFSSDRIKWKYAASIPELCFQVPYELLMEDEVFELLLSKFNPVNIYGELLSDEDKTDDEVVYKILASYQEYLRCCMALTSTPESECHKRFGFRELQRSWVTTVENITSYEIVDYMFHDLEEAAFVGRYKNGVSGFFEIYFAFLAQKDLLKSYKGVEPGTMKEKNALYLQYLMDTRAENESMASTETMYNAEDPLVFPAFRDAIQKYWYQICLFATIGTGNYSMFIELKNHCCNSTVDIGVADSDVSGSMEKEVLWDAPLMVGAEIPF